MSTALTAERPDTEPHVFETTAEWACWRHGMIPSGGSAQRALLTPRNAMPSGSEGGYLDHIVRGGIALGLVIAAAAVTPFGGAVTRGPVDLSQGAMRTPTMTPRRRDEEAPEDVLPSSLASAIPAVTMVETRVMPVDAAAITAEHHVVAIQEALSLSVTQLAELLGVARGTVYGWIRGEIEVPRDHGKAQRLRDLHRVARSWRARSGENLGRLATAPLGDDQPSLIELLAAESWDEAAIDRALLVLAEHLEARVLERRQAQERGVGRARPMTAETVELERLRLRGLIS
jgi:excisionase family DNA binding protein